MKWVEQRLGRRIRRGTLELRYDDGEQCAYGDGGPPHGVMHIHRRRTLRRIALDSEFMLGQTYMDGDWSPGEGGLLGVLEVLLNNFPPPRARGVKAWLLWAARPLQQWNRAAAARRNIASHYDLDDWLFQNFLDADMHYSCAYFEDPDMDLESAQRAKAAHIRRKLCLRPGDRVLDIGCGWGSMAIHLARHEQVEVVGLTLSSEQQRLAQERVRQAGVADRVEIRLQDYRDVTGPFERIVSVGMFEHVGVPFYDTYFDTVRRLLTDDGVALVHTIGRFNPPGFTSPWIRRYIFPGGYIPATSEVMSSVERVGIRTTDIEVLRLHYAYTLAHWQARFQRIRDRVATAKSESFCRMWEFYLAVSEAAFRWRGMMVLQLQLARQQDAVPLTRDYLYSGEREERRWSEGPSRMAS
ncbi:MULTISPECIES: SAM-dependent methyltransferase [unclassified Halorhodospira]|uniref:SAM-dependent methyltransferase n=1 Tax=unclassified Halorhodospira TaxID=2626748 RepID=UPI001EE98C19|nr:MULTISPECIES: cyclopropane-fatty-acyl-phospholipid synthase family protein [unclassified Halorhodospira]MCG5540196.1 cyclopropane-fatty-acyl-phospholipid synthase family protein [Halorhodospira sp. M39old]MCG5545103.1 cyclopropane-fatty-acyl-phospholipid synthase family protein [Halorhodospira sp. M38]